MDVVVATNLYIRLGAGQTRSTLNFIYSMIMFSVAGLTNSCSRIDEQVSPFWW